jgi:hypothetical protein
MGCDLKIHVEIKVKKSGWLHWNHPQIKRNYKLFTKMANVRPSDEEEIEPISEPRGLPADITKTVRFHFAYDEIDLHSASWLDSREIAELQKWFDERFCASSFDRDFGWLMGNQFDMYEFPEDFEHTNIEDVRFVFWFMG